MRWHERKFARLLLRAAGALLLVLAYAAVRALSARASAGEIDQDAAAYLLAAFAILSASTGAALLLLGSHLFDRIEIAGPWRRRSDRD